MMNVDFISSYLPESRWKETDLLQRTRERKGNAVWTRSQDLTVLPGLRNNLFDKIICIAAARIVLAAL